MGRTEVKPKERESLKEQSSLPETFQEGASLGNNTSTEKESKSASPLNDTKAEVENSKFTRTNTILITIPTTDILVCIFFLAPSFCG